MVDANVAAIQSDILAHGTVQASMLLVSEFEVYSSGVFTTRSEDYIGVYAVKIVDWGKGKDEVSGLDYWTVKKSWNDGWGMAGYFWIERVKNILAIEDGVVAGTVDKF
jgi:C1A family cysteine protease